MEVVSQQMQYLILLTIPPPNFQLSYRKIFNF